MSYGKSCENCAVKNCAWNCGGDNWKPIPCPYCAGFLSEVREHKGRKYRHCYSCHFEFFLNEVGQAVPMRVS